MVYKSRHEKEDADIRQLIHLMDWPHRGIYMSLVFTVIFTISIDIFYKDDVPFWLYLMFAAMFGLTEDLRRNPRVSWTENDITVDWTILTFSEKKTAILIKDIRRLEFRMYPDAYLNRWTVNIYLKNEKEPLEIEYGRASVISIRQFFANIERSKPGLVDPEILAKVEEQYLNKLDEQYCSPSAFDR